MFKPFTQGSSVTRNNLPHVDMAFPLGAFTAVTGISGSEKSSLVSEALFDLVGRWLGQEPATAEGEEQDDAEGL